MTTISNQAEAAREAARQQGGQFGAQVRRDNDNVQLAGTVPQEQACLRTGGGELHTRRNKTAAQATLAAVSDQLAQIQVTATRAIGQCTAEDLGNGSLRSALNTAEAVGASEKEITEAARTAISGILGRPVEVGLNSGAAYEPAIRIESDITVDEAEVFDRTDAVVYRWPSS